MAAVMRWVAAAAILLGTARLAAAQEIYQWRDKAGNVHFSNVPTAQSEPTGLRNDPSEAPQDTSPGGSGAAASPPSDEDVAYASDASNRRSALERQLRGAERQMKDIDAKLAALARARTRNAQGSAATGGVGTQAAGVQSDEELALTEERARAAKQVEALKGNYGQLRDEVTARMGSTPDWWINVH